jgi:hypothetical protein
MYMMRKENLSSGYPKSLLNNYEKQEMVIPNKAEALSVLCAEAYPEV